MIRVVVSDLHLGYSNSVLTNPANARLFGEALRGLSGGHIDELILNGDTFEGCVPEDAGKENPWGLPPSVTMAAQNLFIPIADCIDKVVFIPGNHDLVLSDMLVGKEEILFGTTLAPKLVRAYPVYWAQTSEGFLAIHHGHFLDPLVLGLEHPGQYAALFALTGATAPVISTGDIPPLATIDKKTRSFIKAVWSYNSPARKIEWDVLRRFSKEGSACFCYPKPGEFARMVYPRETFDKGLRAQLKWFAEVIVMDPFSPPTGRRNYIVLGHDHGGGQERPKVADIPITVLNTGGWVRTGKNPRPHFHVVVFKDSDASTHCVKI